MEKVLLIDDEKVTRERLKKIIEKEGFQTLLAEDGREGMEVFEKERPDIVITDINMQHKDGMQVLHEVKEMSPETEVILITGRGDYDTVIQALRKGALDYLKKPIDIEHLVETLGRCREKSINKKKQNVPGTILVLDDEELPRTQLSKILSREGYQVFSGQNGVEGMKIFEDKKIDVVMTDLMMPEKDGLAVLHEVKEQTDDVEVIMITGHGDEETAIDSMRHGAINFIKKPIDIDQMIAAVDLAFDKLHLKRSLAYRTRELELANKLLATVTAEKEIILDIKESLPGPAMDFVREFVDSLPAPFFIADSEARVAFSNVSFAKAFENEPDEIQADWAENLAKIGINGLVPEDLKKSILGLFEVATNETQVITVGEYSYVLLTKITVVTATGNNKFVLVVFRGERK